MAFRTTGDTTGQQHSAAPGKRGSPATIAGGGPHPEETAVYGTVAGPRRWPARLPRHRCARRTGSTRAVFSLAALPNLALEAEPTS